MNHFDRLFAGLALASVLLYLGCGDGSQRRAIEEEPDHEPTLPVAPWSGDKLTPTDVPAVYLSVWEEAENKASCALIAPDSLGVGAGATSRSAAFAGGWGVAYDLPAVRSAFGIAGTGTVPTDDMYDAWPRAIQWDDGSVAEYGPEGGTGPNQLAYLRVAGQGCLYNVWSRMGVEHLELLMRHLRFVNVG